MRLSINWLKDFVDLTTSPAELAEKLTLAGLEIEAIETFAPAFQGVVVAQVQALEPHPQADRLQIALVWDGRQQHRVVCGAPNVRVGGLYPLAPVGAVLPPGKPLKAAKIRGIRSEGMLLAEDELGLSEDHSGLMALPPETPVGADVAQILGLEDVVLEVAVTPNRPDCLSVLGLAREVAALYDLPLRRPAVEIIEDPEPVERYAQVVIEDPENCPRYTARMIVDLEVRPSPFWLRRRLQVSGLRAINNLVDVTNYVMLEYGQPLHAFDFQSLRQGRIVVRRPAAGEENFTTLDGQSRPLVAETLLICDAVQPVAIAGVMGGLDSEVTAATTQVLLESAYFHPPSIRRTAKRLGLSSESAYRFERGVDPGGVVPALNRAAQLMAMLGSGRVLQGIIDVYPRPLSSPRLSLRLSRTNAVLGTNLAKGQVREIMRRLQMPPVAEEEDTLHVQVPSYRGDLTREIDLIEEVARLHGFDQIPVTLPRVEMWARRPGPEARWREQAREILRGLGFAEVINYAFQPERFTTQLTGGTDAVEFVRVANPISEEQSVMRVMLLPGLVETMRRNIAHLTRDMKIFELGMVFHPRPEGQLPQETLMLAGLMSGARQAPAWNLPTAALDFFDLKGVVENLLEGLRVGEAAFQPVHREFLRQGTAILAGGRELGFLGELHPEVVDRCELKQPAWVFEINFQLLAAAAQECPQFQPLPRYPAVFRDLAIILPAAIPAARVEEVLFACGRPFLAAVELFDVYTGPPVPAGQRSLAYHLCYRDPHRTLSEADVNPWHEAIIRGVQEELGARLRT